MIEAPINGEQVGALQVLWRDSLYIIPWLYGVFSLTGKFVDKIFEPLARAITRKIISMMSSGK